MIVGEVSFILGTKPNATIRAGLEGGSVARLDNVTATGLLNSPSMMRSFFFAIAAAAHVKWRGLTTDANGRREHHREYGAHGG